MTSILTNASATVALKALRSINDQLTASQGRISTGHRVDSAKDDAALFSIATSMRSDLSSMSTVESLLGVGQGKVDMAEAGTNTAIGIVGKIKDLLVSAKDGSTDKTAIQAQITQLQSQLTTVAKSSAFDGSNLLFKASGSTAASTVDITASMNRDSAGNVTTTSISVDTTKTMLIDAGTQANGMLSKSRTGTNSGSYSVAGGAADISVSATSTSNQIDDMIEAVTGALSDMQASSASLGATSSGIDMQGEFVKTLKSVLDKGISSLVDTDMEAESAKLSALQVRQQLAIQTLSVANNNAQNILALFR
jgi:flagellin